MRFLKTIDAHILRIMRRFVTSPVKEETLHQFIKFSLIGTVNTLIDFLIWYGLTRGTAFFGEHILWASIISFCAGTTFGFFAHRTWTFLCTGKATIGEASKFFATTLSGLFLSQGLLYLLLTWETYDLVAKISAMVSVIVWNFSLKKSFVFAPKTIKYPQGG